MSIEVFAIKVQEFSDISFDWPSPFVSRVTWVDSGIAICDNMAVVENSMPLFRLLHDLANDAIEC